MDTARVHKPWTQIQGNPIAGRISPVRRGDEQSCLPWRDTVFSDLGLGINAVNDLASVVADIKQALDPDGILNPGAAI